MHCSAVHTGGTLRNQCTQLSALSVQASAPAVCDGFIPSINFKFVMYLSLT
jgi:hypothetical protein